VIRLSVPGTLEYRDVAMRVVSAASKLVQPGRRGTKFDVEVVSAFGEAFNNIAIHGYQDEPGEVEVEIELEADGLTLRISDRGRSFDPLDVPDPELDDLPERGMGLFIIRSFVDRMVYTPGDPNVLELEKRCSVAQGAEDSAPPRAQVEGAQVEGARVSIPPATPSGVKASKSGRAGPSRVRPVRRADSAPPRASAGHGSPVSDEPRATGSPVDLPGESSPRRAALPLGSRRK
jgi:serine/threonine-protein kinase RsbW